MWMNNIADSLERWESEVQNALSYFCFILTVLSELSDVAGMDQSS